MGKNVPDEIIKFIDEAREKIFIERLFLTLGSNIEFRTHIQRLEGEVAEVRKTVTQKDERIKDLEGEINKILQLKSVRLHRKIEDIKRSYGLDKNE